MAFPKRMRTSHTGPKSSANDGWWGRRIEAKWFARKARRREDREAVGEQRRD
jgi:hypothetical protein